MIEIRKAKISDLSGIIEVAESAFEHEYNKENLDLIKKLFLEKITSRFKDIYVSVDNEKVVGYAIYGPILLTGTFELYQIGVKKEQREKGIGTWLLKESLQRYSNSLKELGIDLYACYLTTSSDNPAGQKLYEKAGFKHTGEIRDSFIGKGNVEIIMASFFSDRKYPEGKLWDKEK